MAELEDLLDGPHDRRGTTYAEALSLLKDCLQTVGAGKMLMHRADVNGTPCVDVNMSLLTLDIWVGIEDGIARQLFAGLVDLVDEQGALYTQDGPSDDHCGAYPLLAQTALDVYRQTGDRLLLEGALPALSRYITWAKHYYEGPSTKSPGWQKQNESYVQHSYQQASAPIDIIALLTCESGAYLEICRLVSATDPVQPEIATWHQMLGNALLRDYWSADHLAFRDVDQRGRPLKRGTIASLLPLRWSGLPESHRRSLLREGLSGSGYMTEYGLRRWIPLPDDPAPPPVTGKHQILMIDDIGPQLANRIVSRVRSARRETGKFPDTLFASPQPNNSEDEAFTAAAYLKAVHLAEPTKKSVANNATVRWLEKHRIGILAGFVGLVAVITFGTSSYLINKETIIHSSIRPTVGLAVQHYDEGRYQEAEGLLRSLLRQAHNKEEIELKLANTLFQQGKLDEASAHYKKVLESGSTAPKAMLNLALTLYRLGRKDEARYYYETFLVRHGDKHPELTARAKTAIALINEDVEK